MATVLVSGSAGFIGGYVVEELLRRGHEVVGIDNLSKYGRVTKSYDEHRSYTFVEGDARDVDLLTKLLFDCDHFIAGRGDDRRDLVLPHLCLRPAGHQRAHYCRLL